MSERGTGLMTRASRQIDEIATFFGLNRLSGAKGAIGPLADLTGEQLDSVPPAVNRFADGRRTLEEVIERVIAHQAARLETLQRAVA